MPATSRKVFVNLAVSDLDRSKEFFGKLGFTFNPQFTDDKAACMVISDEAFAMLLQREFFQTFTPKELCDTSKATEVLIAISADSRDEVDQLVNTALANGGSPARDPEDYGFMYQWAFQDPDGHTWEVAWMDPAAIEQ